MKVGRPKKTSREIYCFNCGELITGYRNPRYNKQFCNDECKYEYNRKKRHGEI